MYTYYLFGYYLYIILLFVISSAQHKEQKICGMSCTKLSDVLPALPVQLLSVIFEEFV